MGIEGVEWGSARRGPRQRPPLPSSPQPQFPRGILDECVAVRRNDLAAILRGVCQCLDVKRHTVQYACLIKGSAFLCFFSVIIASVNIL